MTESELYQKHLKPYLDKKGIFHFRIEHPRIPDVYTAKNGKVLWIELKCVSNYKSGFIKPKWRPGQLSWMKEHMVLGGHLFVLCLWCRNNFYFLTPKAFYTTIELNQTKELKYE